MSADDQHPKDCLWRTISVHTLRYIYYEEDDMWVGWLEDYPDYRTQGASLEELQLNLKDIQQELESGTIPCVRRIGELVIP